MRIHVITIKFKNAQFVDNLSSNFYSYTDGIFYKINEQDYYVTEFEGNSEYDFDTFQIQLEEDLDKLNVNYKLITYE